MNNKSAFGNGTLAGIKSIVKNELIRNSPGGSFIEDKAGWDLKLQNKYHNLSIETLLDSPDFFNTADWLYPCHRKDLITMFEAKKKYGIETVITIEGIGSGKSKKNSLLVALQTFKLLTLVNPQEHYGIAPGDTIAFILMSRTEKHAKKVTFRKLLPIFNCPFFNEYFPSKPSYREIEQKRQLPAELRFPKDIVIFPGTGSAASALGYDIFGAAIDEANYLEVTSDSKKSRVGTSGNYDAAEDMHHEISGRMESRFMTRGGTMPGFICMFSNPRYRTDFLERWARKAKLDRIDDERWIDKKGKLLLIRRPTWVAKRHVYSDETFKFDFKNLKVV